MTAAITPLLLDTDVLIDYLRGRSEAIDYVDTLPNPLFVSVITVGELYAGVRDGAECSRLDTFSNVLITLLFPIKAFCSVAPNTALQQSGWIGAILHSEAAKALS